MYMSISHVDFVLILCVVFPQAVDQMMRMYEMFVEKDCTTLEINPFAQDSQDRCTFVHVCITAYNSQLYTLYTVTGPVVIVLRKVLELAN